MGIGILVIGDEPLPGKRPEKHLSTMIETAGAWSRIARRRNRRGGSGRQARLVDCARADRHGLIAITART